MTETSLNNSIISELIKLRGLPSVLTAMLGTVATSIGLNAAVAASATVTADAGHVTLQTIPFLQIGAILIGVLAFATEYTGSQIRTTLASTPNRLRILAGKTTAYLLVAAITSATALSAGLVTARITLTFRQAAPIPAISLRLVIGAAVYLVLIGMLGFALAGLLRSLIPSLVTMLALVLVASPLLSGFTDHARYLPDRAGSILYLPDPDPVLTPGVGTLVLVAWIATTATAAASAFLIRDT